jgi:putative transposase
MKTHYDALLPALKRLLPSEKIDGIGRTTRFIRRLREISASAFVWSVVLSRFGQSVPGFEQARQWFHQLTGKWIWPRPFQMRFKSESTVHLFERAFEQAVGLWRRGTTRHPLARHFADIVVCDSSLVQVSDVLRRWFYGTLRTAASLKVLLAVSLWGLRPLAARIVPGHRHDARIDLPLEFLRPRSLVLFDKGFLDYARLQGLNDRSVFFICPFKQNCDAQVTRVHEGSNHLWKAIGRSQKALQLRTILPKGKRIRKTSDLQVLLTDARRRVHQAIPARIVIVPGRDARQRAYVTNLPADRWAPRAIVELYRLRWQIELLFKELKQHLNLCSVPTKDLHAAQVLLWASLIALALSRTVAGWLAPTWVGLAHAIRPAVLSRALRAAVPLLAHLLVLPTSETKHLLQSLAHLLLAQTRQLAPDRQDSFKRLLPLLPAPA